MLLRRDPCPLRDDALLSSYSRRSPRHQVDGESLLPTSSVLLCLLTAAAVKKVEAPSGLLLYETLHFEEEDDGIYDFVPKEPGAYRFCFNNEMSRWTAKVVSFYLVGDENEEGESPTATKPAPASAGLYPLFSLNICIPS